MVPKLEKYSAAVHGCCRWLVVDPGIQVGSQWGSGRHAWPQRILCSEIALLLPQTPSITEVKSYV